MPGKKLINDPDSTVDEALSGLVASRHNLALIEGRRVVVVKDLADLKYVVRAERDTVEMPARQN